MQKNTSQYNTNKKLQYNTIEYNTMKKHSSTKK